MSKQEEQCPATEPPPLIIYHADCLDGIASAWCAWRHHKEKDIEVELLPATYGDSIPKEKLLAGRKVYILDFSYSPDELVTICDLVSPGQVVLLDHHITMIRYIAMYPESYPCNFTYSIHEDKAGCVLTWEWFYPTKAIPQLLSYIEDRDLWRFKLPGTRAICESLSSYPLEVKLIDQGIENLIWAGSLKSNGEVLLRAKAKEIKEIINLGINWSKIRLPRGAIISVPCINASAHYRSELGAELLHLYPSALLVMIYIRTSKEWKVSLRGRKGGIDVAEIAEGYGGGGHATAASFYLSDTEFRETLT